MNVRNRIKNGQFMVQDANGQQVLCEFVYVPEDVHDARRRILFYFGTDARNYGKENVIRVAYYDGRGLDTMLRPVSEQEQVDSAVNEYRQFLISSGLTDDEPVIMSIETSMPTDIPIRKMLIGFSKYCQRSNRWNAILEGFHAKDTMPILLFLATVISLYLLFIWIMHSGFGHCVILNDLRLSSRQEWSLYLVWSIPCLALGTWINRNNTKISRAYIAAVIPSMSQMLFLATDYSALSLASMLLPLCVALVSVIIARYNEKNDLKTLTETVLYMQDRLFLVQCFVAIGVFLYLFVFNM